MSDPALTPIDPRERKYISPYSTAGFGLTITVAGVPGNADGAVMVTLTQESTGQQIFTKPAASTETGLYTVATTPTETSVPGDYTVSWSYSIMGEQQDYLTYLTIGQPSPAYDSLPDTMKDIVDVCWIRFADLFDSPAGGPNLQTYFQAHYGRGRVAELLRIAMGTLNTAAQPFQTYTIDGLHGAQFPILQWGPLLERSLYVECVRHLIRSYVEQPNLITGAAVTRVDRRDYMDRWRTVLADELETLRSQLDIFKMSNMSLGKPAVLVSGGVFGRYAPTRVAGSIAARPRMWSRWY